MRILGLHWMLDAQERARGLDALNVIRATLLEVPGALGLTIVGAPQVHEHPATAEQPRTLAGLIMISESHLSIHALPEQGLLHCDLFSCAPFDRAKALELFQQRFEFSSFEEMCFERGAGLKKAPEGA